MNAALFWDAWSRPSPDLPAQLRAQADLSSAGSNVDPNFQAHLKDFLKKGSVDDVNTSQFGSFIILKIEY